MNSVPVISTRIKENVYNPAYNVGIIHRFLPLPTLVLMYANYTCVDLITVGNSVIQHPAVVHFVHRLVCVHTYKMYLNYMYNQRTCLSLVGNISNENRQTTLSH